MKKIGLFLVITLGFVMGCVNDRTPKEMQEAISKSNIYKRLDKLCTEMPTPAGGEFVKKKFGGNTNLASLVFYYRTDEDLNKSKVLYLEWAKKNGWRESDYNKYVKGNQSIVIELVNSTSSDIAVLCQESR